MSGLPRVSIIGNAGQVGVELQYPSEKKVKNRGSTLRKKLARAGINCPTLDNNNNKKKSDIILASMVSCKIHNLPLKKRRANAKRELAKERKKKRTIVLERREEEEEDAELLASLCRIG